MNRESKLVNRGIKGDKSERREMECRFVNRESKLVNRGIKDNISKQRTIKEIL